MDVRSPLNQCIALALVGILFLDPIVAAAAELAVDKAAGGNTQLGQAGNGVPVVNIATPNGSGLSHNKFREYNVGHQGLILNNATNKTQSTQLGGIIIGNPNLQGRAASTILNEVTGGNRSRLSGYTEVAGQSARIIVANPHGITCSGCGFINTPRATLSTGKPVVDAGRLDRFEVDGGDIAIEGAGLNASNIDQFDLITRSAKLNAELHARNLDIVTGRNDVKADSLAATARADDGSAQPGLAIDSSALGGMYADAIRLVGTEAGVGVRLAGDMAASGGDIKIDANGKLILAQAAASGDLRVNAQSAELIGKTYAGGSATLVTQGDLENHQGLAARNEVRLSSGGQLGNQGVIEAGVNPDGSRNATGDLYASAKALRNSGSLVASGNLDVNVSQTLGNQGGTLSAQGNARVSAGKLDNRRGRVLTGGDLALSAVELDNQAGLLNGASQVQAQLGQLGQLDNRGGELSSRTGVSLQAGSIDNRSGKVIGEQTLQLQASGAVNNQGGSLGANQQLQVKVTSLDNSQQGDVSSQGDLDVQVAGKLDNHDQGRIGANGAARVQAGSLDSRLEAGDEAYLYAGNDLSLLAAEDSDYSLYDKKKKGSFGSKKTQRDEVTDVRNIGSEIISGGDLTLVSEGDQRYQKAVLDSGADLTLDSGGAVTFEAVKDLRQESHEKSKGDLAWNSAKGKGNTDETVRQSQLIAQGNLAIKAVEGLKIDLNQIDQQTVSQTIDAMVQADPNLAWLKEAEARGDVDWRRVKKVHESFKYRHSGIRVGAAIAIAILVAAATYGAASGMVGSAAGATAGSGTAMAAGTATTTTVAGVATTSTVAAGWGNAMAATALSSAAGTGAASLVSNRGDLGETLKDVTSKDSLKAYATAALIAGFSTGVTDGWGRELTAEGNYKLIDYGDRLKAYMANTALKGLLNGENEEAWLSIASTGALMELYQYSVGRDPEIRPGIDRPDGPRAIPLEDGTVPNVLMGEVVLEGKNIGLNWPSLEACQAVYSVCHGTYVSDALNKIPGFNSFATLHDTWMNQLEIYKGADMSVLENLGSMPPALFINYGALYEKYRLLNDAVRENEDK